MTLAQWYEDKKGPLAILAIAAVAIIAVLGIGSLLQGDDEPDGPDLGAARVVCEEMVRQKLVNPSTADFAYPDEQTSSKISGTLTGENKLGGKVTMNYSCNLSEGTVQSATLVER